MRRSSDSRAQQLQRTLADLERHLNQIDTTRHIYLDASEQEPCLDPACVALHLRDTARNSETSLKYELDTAEFHYRKNAVRSLMILLARQGDPGKQLDLLIGSAVNAFREADRSAIDAQARYEALRRTETGDQTALAQAYTGLDRAVTTRVHCGHRLTALRRHRDAARTEGFLTPGALL